MLDACCLFSRNNMQVNGLRRGQREEKKLEYFTANFCCVSMAIANLREKQIYDAGIAEVANRKEEKSLRLYSAWFQ